MSYFIAATGNLLRTPELRTSEKGVSYCYTDVIVNSRHRGDDGTWKDLGSARYSLTVFRSAAENLVDAANHGGNLRILFTGQVTDRDYTRDDGTTGTSRDVIVDEIAISLTGQKARLATS